MLRATVHEEEMLCRLEIAGRLAGPWVDETEHAWRSSQCSGKQIEVDIREVTAIDDAGRQLLSAMHQSGARLVVQGVWMMALIEEVTAGRPANGTNRQARRKSPAQREIPGTGETPNED